MPAAPGKGGAGLHKTPNRIWTDTAREIRNTRSRFLSILVLSALAVAFLAGLRTTAPDMERSADRYFDEHNLMDARCSPPWSHRKRHPRAEKSVRYFRRGRGLYSGCRRPCKRK
jgi:hypothetical protein